MPFIQITTENGTEIIFNSDHIIRMGGSGDDYNIDFTEELAISQIPKAEYERIKDLLKVVTPDSGSIYNDRGLTVL